MGRSAKTDRGSSLAVCGTLTILLGARVLIGAPQAASAPSATLSKNWKQIQTPAFTVAGDAPEVDLRNVLEEMEGFRDVMKRVFPNLQVVSRVPFRVIVFKDYPTYRRFAPSNSGGYFNQEPDINLLIMPSSDNGIDNETLFHELTHFFVHQNSIAPPAWMDEGLAEFFSTFQWDGKGRRVIIGKYPSHDRELWRSTFVPLKDIVAPQGADLLSDPYRAEAFYGESWALVHYLMVGRQQFSTAWINAYHEALKTTANIDQAFQKAFGADLNMLTRDVRDYVNRLTVPGIAINRPRAQVAPPAAERMREADALAWQGSILVHLGRPDDAEKPLRASLALDPQQTEAAVSLAEVQLMRGHVDQAVTGLQEIARDKPESMATQYYLGEALTVAHRHEDAFAAFDRAVRINGEAPGPWFQLSLAALRLHRVAQSAAAFEHAMSLEYSPSYYRGRASVALGAGYDDLAASSARAYIERVDRQMTSVAYAAFIAALADRRGGRPDAALQILTAVEPSIQARSWTANVQQFLRGTLDAEQFFKRAKSVGEKTEAHTYIGFMLEIAGKTDEALIHFRWVTKEGAKNYSEYEMAQNEIERLAPAAPTLP